jgi:hypothetical protein
MKRIHIATALALFALAPAAGVACDLKDASMAPSYPTEQLGMAAPAASTTSTSVAAKTPALKTLKQVPDRTKNSASDAKLVAVKTN